MFNALAKKEKIKILEFTGFECHSIVLHSIDWLNLMPYLPNMVINESRDF